MREKIKKILLECFDEDTYTDDEVSLEYYWFYKDEFEELLDKIEKVIKGDKQ